MVVKVGQEPCPQDAEAIRAASRQKRAERKLAQQRAVAGGVWTRCLYRVPGKERYCAQQRSKHSTQFCGTHMGETAEKGRRVPCPVDPNHTVFEHQLAAHAKICNHTILQARMEAQPYFSKGINSGPPLADEGREEEERDDTSSRPVFDEDFLLDLISRVSAAHRSLVGEIATEVLGHIPEVQALHRARTEDGTGFRKGRHVLQQASLVGHLVKRGLIGAADSTTGGGGGGGGRPSLLHVEMGAGRGALGQSIAVAFPGADVTMVERSSVRRKFENRLDGVSARARIDIRDLDMSGLPSLAPSCGDGREPGDPGGGGGGGGGRPVVAVAKHLCGVATDLALRAMLTLEPRSGVTSLQGEAAAGGVIEGDAGKIDGGAGGDGAAAAVAGGGGGGVGGDGGGTERTTTTAAAAAVAAAEEAAAGTTAVTTAAPVTAAAGTSTAEASTKADAATAGAAAAAGAGAAAAAAAAASTATVAGSRVGGVAIATCCHHVCNWRDYAGRDFLARHGFSARDFEAMRHMSAWISLEPDAGARRNNKYPDERHPSAASLSGSRAGGKIPAAAAGGGGGGVEDHDTAKTAASAARLPPPPAIPEEQEVLDSEAPPGAGLAPLGPGVAPAAPAHAVGAALSAAPAGAPAADSNITGKPREPGVGGGGSGGGNNYSGRGERGCGVHHRTTDRGDGDEHGAGGHHHHYRRSHRHPHQDPGSPIPAPPAAAAAAAAGGGSGGAVLPRPLMVLAALTPAEKAMAARECKRLLDRGRRAFVEERLGLASEVVHFVGREVTPENALLLGFRRPPGEQSSA